MRGFWAWRGFCLQKSNKYVIKLIEINETQILSFCEAFLVSEFVIGVVQWFMLSELIEDDTFDWLLLFLHDFYLQNFYFTRTRRRNGGAFSQHSVEAAARSSTRAEDESKSALETPVSHRGLDCLRYDLRACVPLLFSLYTYVGTLAGRNSNDGNCMSWRSRIERIRNVPFSFVSRLNVILFTIKFTWNIAHVKYNYS